jgi:hypothetical protein
VLTPIQGDSKLEYGNDAHNVGGDSRGNDKRRLKLMFDLHGPPKIVRTVVVRLFLAAETFFLCIPNPKFTALSNSTWGVEAKTAMCRSVCYMLLTDPRNWHPILPLLTPTRSLFVSSGMGDQTYYFGV